MILKFIIFTATLGVAAVITTASAGILINFNNSNPDITPILNNQLLAKTYATNEKYFKIYHERSNSGNGNYSFRGNNLNSWENPEIRNFYEQVSKVYGIPKNILLAISINESGVNGFPWPWTLNVDGVAYYYKNRISEYKAIKKFIRDGANFIDIGPMQMDWEYHHDLFKNLWQATNPAYNICASAYFLNRLYNKTNSWSQTVAYYHSATPSYGIPYMQNVFRIKNSI